MWGFVRIDAGLLCFILVIVAAVPVASLRARTYSLGYELGTLKLKEQELQQQQFQLQSELAMVQKSIREKYLHTTNNGRNSRPQKLQLPTADTVIHPREQDAQ